MTIAQEAYKEAQEKIAQNGDNPVLYMRIKGLEVIPPEIATLTNLTNLHLSNTQITSLEPLAKLTNLTKLHLDSPWIISIEPLASLTNLTDLDINYTQITTLEALAKLANLTKLRFGSPHITSFEALAKLTKLTKLYIGSPYLTSLEPLAKLTNLTELNLSKTQITSLETLTKLTNLTRLDLGRRQKISLEPLDKLTNLTELNLCGVRINMKSAKRTNIKHITEPDPDLVRAVKALVKGDATALQELQALLHEGREVNGRENSKDWGVYHRPKADGSTLLESVVCYNNLVVAELLLEAGARIDVILKNVSYGRKTVIQSTSEYSAVSDCRSPEMAALLGRYKAPFWHFDDEDFPFATGAVLIAEQNLTSEDFNQISLPRFGKVNPETCDNPFYLDQIRTGLSAYDSRKNFANDGPESMSQGPVWSFQRHGRSITQLPDGLLLLIGGEHEDGMDPDSYIYNDVTVLDRKGGVQHFLYPKDIFPQTSFHSATIIGDYILLIGNRLGYTKLRQKSKTQVLRLNLNNFSVESVETQGENPGWISRHNAVCKEDDILISGGHLSPGYTEAEGSYALNLPTMTWRLTSQQAI